MDNNKMIIGKTCSVQGKVDCSIIIPVYFNEGLILQTMEDIYNDILETNPHLAFEVIFVDDGSGDNSIEELFIIKEKFPNTVKIIKLTRNFGQGNAIIAGIAYSKGDCILSLSADGQEPASLINEMLYCYYNGDWDIIAGSRIERDESYYRTLTSNLFYGIIRKLSFPSMPKGGFDCFLLDRKVIKVILDNQEDHLFFQGAILWTGFKTKYIEYKRLKRKYGLSKWTFGKKLTYLIDGIMSYSFFPIRVMSIMGIIFSLLGFIYASIIFISRIIWGNPIYGWAPIMIMILLTSGFQMIMLGVIGEYLWRALAQARNRPKYVIEKIYE